MLQSLGVVCVRLGRYAESIAHLERALPLAERIGNKPLQGHVLRNIAFVSRRIGNYQHAQESLRKALALAKDMGTDNREARNLEGHVLNGFALLYRRLGHDHSACRPPVHHHRCQPEWFSRNGVGERS